MTRKNRLTIDAIDSVGVVDEPDNPPATLLFWKRRVRKESPDAGAVTSEGVLMDGQTIASEEAQEVVGKSDEAVEVAAEPEAVEVGKSEAETEAAEVQVDDLAKSAAEQIAKANQERDAAVALLAEEVDKRLTQEWVGKAKPFETLLGPSAEIGPLLRKLADAAPDAYQRLEQALTVAMNRADLAKIFGEVGRDTGETGSPLERRDRWVTEYRKANPAVNEAEARGLFWKSHPDLKKESRES